MVGPGPASDDGEPTTLSVLAGLGSLWWGFLAALAITVSWAVKRRPVKFADRT